MRILESRHEYQDGTQRMGSADLEIKEEIVKSPCFVTS